MGDQLEKFIMDNREAFDDATPSDQAWSKIDQKLTKRSSAWPTASCRPCSSTRPSEISATPRRCSRRKRQPDRPQGPATLADVRGVSRYERIRLNLSLARAFTLKTEARHKFRSCPADRGQTSEGSSPTGRIPGRGRSWSLRPLPLFSSEA